MYQGLSSNRIIVIPDHVTHDELWTSYLPFRKHVHGSGVARVPFSWTICALPLSRSIFHSHVSTSLPGRDDANPNPTIQRLSLLLLDNNPRFVIPFSSGSGIGSSQCTFAIFILPKQRTHTHSAAPPTENGEGRWMLHNLSAQLITLFFIDLPFQLDLTTPTHLPCATHGFTTDLSSFFPYVAPHSLFD